MKLHPTKKLITITIALLSLTFSCNQPTSKVAVENKGSTIPSLSKVQTEFLAYWNQTYNTEKRPLLNVFRTRYFTKTDLKELDKLLVKRNIKTDFTAALSEIKSRTELAIDTTKIEVGWINNTDVETCNQVDPDFWPCFDRRYQTPVFYYLSPPLFSADSLYCLLHVNYRHQTKGKSYGGGRLYHKTKKGWDEIAYLSYWGKITE